MRTSSGGRAAACPTSSSVRAWAACAAPAMAALDAMGSAASTMIWASAVRPRRMSAMNAGGITTAAPASPRPIRSVSSAREDTAPTKSKFPVLVITRTSARLSEVFDSSNTSVRMWRTSVWIA